MFHHLKRHFDSPEFFSIYDRYAGVRKVDIVKHFQRFVPHLTAEEQAAVVEVCRK